MRKLILLLTTAIMFTACSDDDDFGNGGALQSVDFNTTLRYDNETYGGLAAAGGDVSLTNNETGDVYTATSDETGVARFESILPGSYTITATQTLTATEFEDLFGYAPTSEEVTFNGSQEQATVNTNVTSTEIILKSARIGDLVIKQIYYAGSSTSQGAVFRDQFIEIFNNSNEVIYADGLYIAQTFGKNTTTTATYTQSSGQYDWTQSIGMSNASANTNYVYADYVFQIPGTGMDYPINPGESMVIAQTGVNHKAPLVDNDGDPLEVANPDLTIDLSGANFEAYLGDWRESIGETPYQWDLQNPAVEDLLIAYWGNENKYSPNKDFIMGNLGRDSFVIFRSDDFDSYADYPTPDVETVVGESTRFYLQIPNNVIIDGVELQHYNPSSTRPKHLASEIDASSINCDAAYNSQSVIRQTEAEVDGRIILKDTNNSAEDFVVLSKANPWGFAE